MAKRKKKSKPTAVVFDVDGTLSSADWRTRFVSGPGYKDWPAFHAGMKYDRPVQEVIDAARRLKKAGHAIIVLTLRPERFRDITEKWLRGHGVPFDELWLRPATDYRPGKTVKRSIYEKHLAPRYRVVGAVDDYDVILGMWTEVGVPWEEVVDPSHDPYKVDRDKWEPPKGYSYSLPKGASDSGTNSGQQRLPVRVPDVPEYRGWTGFTFPTKG